MANPSSSRRGTVQPAQPPAPQGDGGEDLTSRNVQIIARIDAQAKAERSTLDRAIDRITCFCGSMGFIWVHLVWFLVWIGLGTLPGVPEVMRFDRFPFQLLTMTVSLEAILLSGFILITQNRQGMLAERRNHLDLQINLLAEQETTKILRMLEMIAEKLGIDEDDPEISELEQDTSPEHVISQIEKIIEQKVRPASTDKQQTTD